MKKVEKIYLIKNRHDKQTSKGSLEKILVFPSNDVMAVNVTTKAFQPVDHIYHDVTIYKNGIWQSSNRYENWGKVELNSYIKVSAQSGDYIEVYVDHYTDHGNCVESSNSSKSRRF